MWRTSSGSSRVTARVRSHLEGGRGDLHRGAADRLRRRLPPRAVQPRGGADPRAALSRSWARSAWTTSRWTSARDDRGRPGDTAVLIGADGASACSPRSSRATWARSTTRSPAASRAGYRASTTDDRRLWPDERGGGAAPRAHRARRAARMPGSSAARCATCCAGVRVDDFDLVVTEDARRPARDLAQAAGAHVFALSERFGAWRVIAKDRSWQADVTPPAAGPSNPTWGCGTSR